MQKKKPAKLVAWHNIVNASTFMFVGIPSRVHYQSIITIAQAQNRDQRWYG
jgi:hypothetical protein